MKTQKEMTWFVIPESWQPGYDEYMEQMRRTGQAASQKAQLELHIEMRLGRAAARQRLHAEWEGAHSEDAENAAKYPADEPVYSASSALVVQFVILYAIGGIVLFALWSSL